MTFEENLKLATTVLDEIKKTVTTSNDIIPAVDLPVMDTQLLPEYINRFGIDRVQEMLSYTDYAAQLRGDFKDSTLKKLKQDKQISPQTTTYVAITMMGVGECADTSNLAVVLLAKMGCQAPIHALVLNGKKPTGEDFLHMMVVIGNGHINPSELIPTFKKLSDDCVFIDPLLGVVGQANKIDTIKEQMAYLTVFSLKNIGQIFTTKNFKEQAEQIYNTAKAVSGEWQKTIPSYPKPVKKPAASEALKTKNQLTESKASSAAGTELGLFKSDPHASLLKELASFESDPTTKAAFDSINNKNYAQAIRRICTVNNEKSHGMLNIILKFRERLSIIIDEQAGDKKQNALHIAASRNNHVAYDLLIASGAKQDIKDSERKTASDYYLPRLASLTI
ncbi:hypothetical protein GH742_08945 [Legionella sp. MW5194]|uniref:hypothetical protein n=1 Tax=Legionella sp. MW5194 TaxID=2662448 RepID=UPI00193DAE89|nr:hypothetical protein [Legionella sp. MW5194]QRN03983.1 hypothetical protein GH742_08945 [Legionella sp. MW5194]